MNCHCDWFSQLATLQRQHGVLWNDSFTLSIFPPATLTMLATPPSAISHKHGSFPVLTFSRRRAGGGEGMGNTVAKFSEMLLKNKNR